jgi:hypothetical protein
MSEDQANSSPIAVQLKKLTPRRRCGAPGTAVNVGADRFLTNNRRDFPQSIAELKVTYPDLLDVSDAQTAE